MKLTPLKLPVTAAAVAALNGSLAAQCPPGTFDYGPSLELHPENLLVDHYSAAGPLIPAPADYQRAVRDIALVRVAIPGVPLRHDLGWVPNVLVIHTTNATAPELLCANDFYHAAMYPLCCGEWFVLEFPRTINPERAAAEYLAIPGVIAAGPDILGGIGGVLCQSTWEFVIDTAGNWRWYLVDSYPVSFFGSVFCRSNGTWRAIITPGGAITVLCYANCDESLGPAQLSANDFLCFLNRFAAGNTYANCDQSTGTPSLTANDFQCFVNKYAAGCT